MREEPIIVKQDIEEMNGWKLGVQQKLVTGSYV